MSVTAEAQFVRLDVRFDLEHAGPFIRIWCNHCDKHEVLPDDVPGTIEAARRSHCCGPRTSGWDGPGARL